MITLHLKRWHLAVLLYLVSALILVAVRPAMMFTPDGLPKAWGTQTDANTSVFGIQFLFPLLAVLSYWVVLCIDMAFE